MLILLAAGLLADGLAAVWLVRTIRAQSPDPAVVAPSMPPPAGKPSPLAVTALPPPPAAPAARVSYAAAKASFRVLYANYGVYSPKQKKGRMIEVTDLVQALLKQRGWLKVNPGEMKGDPWPGKDKWLYMQYEVMGKAAEMKRKEHAGLTLHQLIKHAGVLSAPAPDETGPPGTADTGAGASEDDDATAATPVPAATPGDVK